MILFTFFTLCLSVVGAVIAPWFAPFLVVLMYRLITLGVNPIIIILICWITAALTTSLIRYLWGILRNFFIKKNKNKQNKNWLTWKMRRWFDTTFSGVKNKKKLFGAITIASGTMIPDIFLVEFGRIKMNFRNFIIAIFIWKLANYTILLYWVDTIIDFFKWMFTFS